MSHVKPQSAFVLQYAARQFPNLFSDAKPDQAGVVVYRVSSEIDAALRRQFPDVHLRFEDAPYSLQTLREACAEIARLHRQYAPEIAKLTSCEDQDRGRGVEVRTTDIGRTKRALEHRVSSVPAEVSRISVIPAAPSG